MIKLPPEKLGSFYLGAEYDVQQGTVTDIPVNYDSRDLTTHAICVGMTGSGKTGLCIGLLEEAAMDNVPAIVIDPKGDMTNLLLQFEGLDPADFRKWVNPDDAARKGMTVDDYAKKTADTWKNGLADWGQDTSRIEALKKSVDYTIYTPGSNSGIPINILGSFAAPKVDFDSDAEMLRERILGTVAALLGMIESKEDPSRSREGILLATLFEHYWRKGEDLDLTKLILGIQKPPFQQLGVFELDTFFPEKDRFDLAMSFNTLIASPQFKYWLQGDPLDIGKLYFTAEGQPRHSIFYIAHLSESERMFFVTLLLNSLITWMRSQSGTSSLRSLLYFDEIFGYFPPTANPPSKKPLLTILKQARAFGVGAVLVTQNPVDIDYKGLSNAGTWFIGKLQTERDKMRVLEGLEGAIAEAGTKVKMNLSDVITGLSSRVFLLHNVHEDQPVVMHTRWVMSYLTGPMTRPQIKDLMETKKAKRSSAATAAIGTSPGFLSSSQHKQSAPPSLDPSIVQKYFSVGKSRALADGDMGPGDKHIEYEPQILATGKVRFYDAKRGVDEIQPIAFLCNPPDEFGRVDWDRSIKVSTWEKALIDKADAPGDARIAYATIPESMDAAKELKSVEDAFSDHLYASQRYVIHEHTGLKLSQSPGESVEDFRMRVQVTAREMRDKELDEIRDKFEDKLDRIEERIRKEEQDLSEAESEVKHRRTQEFVGVAETLFSVLVKGRRRSFSTTASRRRMSSRASRKVEESREDIRELEEDYAEMEKELKENLEEVTKEWDAAADGITPKEISPRRTDVKVDGVFIVWYPYWVNDRQERISAMAG